MRFLLCFFVAVFCFSGYVNAQGSPVYNSKQVKRSGDGKSTAIYNARKSGSGSGPINIKSITSGVKQKRVRASSVKSPYNIGKNSGYITSLTPQQVRDKQAASAAKARKKAAEAREKRAAERAARAEERQKLSSNRTTTRNRNATTREQRRRVQQDRSGGGSSQTKRKRIYVQDGSGLTSPERVFGTVY